MMGSAGHVRYMRKKKQRSKSPSPCAAQAGNASESWAFLWEGAGRPPNRSDLQGPRRAASVAVGECCCGGEARLLGAGVLDAHGRPWGQKYALACDAELKRMHSTLNVEPAWSRTDVDDMCSLADTLACVLKLYLGTWPENRAAELAGASACQCMEDMHSTNLAGRTLKEVQDFPPSRTHHIMPSYAPNRHMRDNM